MLRLFTKARLNAYQLPSYTSCRIFSTRDKLNISSLKKNFRISLPEFVERDLTEQKVSTRKIVSFLWPYIFPKDRKLRIVMLSTLALLVASKGLNAYVPFILKEGIDSMASAHPNYKLAAILFASFAGGKALVVLLQELRNALFSKILLHSVKDVSNRLFWHLHSLDYTFHQQSTKTTLFAVGRSMKGVENFLKYMVQNILPTGLEFILASSVLLGFCGWPYLFTLAGTVGAYTVFTTTYSTKRQEYLKEMRRKNKAVDFVINESLLNYETVKCFNNEKLESERYNHYLSQHMQAAMKTSKSLSFLNSGQQLIFNTGLAVNLLLAVNQVTQGTMSVGDLIMIQTLFMQLQFPLNFMGTIYRELKESQLEVKDLFHMLSIQSKVKEAPNAMTYEYKGGAIQFNNISYAHDPERKIFHGLNLEIKPGTFNAIVGESGSGKSTLFRMLYRLFDPDTGEIIIDGQPLKSLTLSSLRDAIGLVPQNCILFNDSIFFNVIYGNPSASHEDVIRVCKMVNIHDRIMEFPEGYNTHVGELGSKLSGGERQRIVIARCLLKDAKIYLMDEMTSAMDSYNEELIGTYIKEYLKGKTIIYSAHRLSSIVHVDKIFVIGEGKLLESGTHSELLLKGGKYSELWSKYLTRDRVI